MKRKRTKEAPYTGTGNSEKLRPAFAVGNGRSGTHFFQEIMAEDPSIVSCHIETPEADSFNEYCTWHRLPVDSAAFLETRQRRIDEAGASGRMYFESNPYLSLSVSRLNERFDASFIHTIRRPEDVVNSHFVKGWYADPMTRDDARLAPGFQVGWQTNHFFGRMLPCGEEFERWSRLTRIGKLAWMWNTVNLRVAEQASSIPPERYRCVLLDDVDHAVYLELHAFIGGKQPMSAKQFDRIRDARPGKAKRHRKPTDWSPEETREFLNETAPAREKLGIDTRVGSGG
ncbi:hypothetical protein KJ567_05155 [Candidatus Bipolaricaulota bacterium]|nr:hypothetical protein [Candidatus Bipolaricaulota bacterium]